MQSRHWPCNSVHRDLTHCLQASEPSSVDVAFLEDGKIPHGSLSDAQFDALVDAAVGTDVRVDVIMKMLGLWHVRDTIVGNQLLRGVSGGERHRVTTAEMLVGPRRILLMDEISTGPLLLLWASAGIQAPGTHPCN
jgi:ABC-type taurine transport system ATPase subunit